ncbi:MAG: threonine synthase [Alphaproteobacteria bacterium]|nr:threonine synthase [Alphaproteobacteria bacterium]
MKYISTRGGCPATDFRGALMGGLAPDGGLYVPDVWPTLPQGFSPKTYIDTAEAVLSLFMDGFIDKPTLRTLLEKAYASFDVPEVAPLRKLDENLSVLELFHGPTIAFKDVALQLLGRLFDYELRKTGQKITILGATSGDTGSAAIEGCRHAQGAEIYILYPHERPSEVQRRQMTTVNAPNVHAVAVEGNFDDCQAIVKQLFADAAFRSSQNLSAVNSINWARIAAQVVYYVHTAYSYPQGVNFIVPTGNFGNVYAAYVAKKLGAPIRKLVVASNRNDILTRFFESGRMQKSEVEPSLSPSMDIQVSSNFERVLFDALGRDPEALKTCMADFTKQGSYNVPQKAFDVLLDIFTGIRCDDDDTLAAIACTQRDYGYTIDPHTAVAFHAYHEFKDSLEGPVVALACAHPAKFPDAVQKATGKRPPLPEALADLYERPEHFTVIPNSAEAVKKLILG